MTSIADPDYWSLLGLDPGSDGDSLKSAFRREARRWHPDLNGNDRQAEERFKLVNEAYAVLSDHDRRVAWERRRNGRSFSQDPFASGFPDFEEYLSVVLGIGDPPEPDRAESTHNEDQDEPERRPTPSPQPPSPVRSQDNLETTVVLTPDQALRGTAVNLELADGTVIEVDTPPFAGDGWRLRLEGVAPGGRDHFLQLQVVTDEGLRIDGLRVLYRLELFPPDAALGCAVDVPTLSGSVTLQVPPGSSSGRLLRLRERGLSWNDRQGDQLVEVVIVIPAHLNDDEQALYQRLQELSLDQGRI
ncbi:MAG: DnaJ C-terminal domain-containing protein [Synechococcus sp.]|uniref:DnaJ C-terminal domain-containing protein n=1 Tax=Synechococcus sp. PROS-9-1 TaxID=1968775 RepID=UPI000DF9CA25|nr:DnaJ C-terminal domain-containing protein [Synechococcus sp. PROS-9-1]MBC8169182.1 DnaJ domain-containing protein [Synechococcus sp.]MBL6887630.1 DnaJ domain-containing protein [Synechococcus sp. BS30m-G30]QNJ31721.1 DnaJ type II chaperone protein [Synechococcus sp. PROS-9-1]RCL60989.1 MAG: J domain-containing protein [Synechococcus sp. MED-G68]